MPRKLIRPLHALAVAAALTAVLPQGPAQAQSGAYLAARGADRAGDLKAAAQYYTRALAYDPTNAQLMQDVVRVRIALGQVDMAVPVARAMVSDGRRDQLAHLALIAGRVRDADWAGVLDTIEADQGINPLVDGLTQAWATAGQGDMTDALDAFDAVAEQQGLRGFGLYHKALALASAGDFEQAAEIMGDPTAGSLLRTRRALIAYLQILSQLDRQDEALALMDERTGGARDPQMEAIRAAIEAGEPLPFDAVSSPADGIAEVFFSVGFALFGESDPSYTLLYSRIAEYLSPNHVEAILLSAELLEEMEQWSLAEQACQKVPAGHPAFHEAELRRAAILQKSGRNDAAIEALSALARAYPDLADVHMNHADLLRTEERYDEAIAAYDRALDIYGPEDPARWLALYTRGIAHERSGQWEPAEADFRAALELNPDQPLVLNYLGYSLVEKGIKLDEALQMIETAVSARPDSGYIVDSLGWVLFTLGRYDEAVAPMERAAALLPTDPIVNDHLGDALWAVGRYREAEFQWKRALSFGPEPEDAERIRAKLELGLDAVLADEGAPPLKMADGD